MCFGFKQVTVLSHASSMKTTVAVLLTCALSLAEKLTINTDLLDKVRQVKDEPLTPHSRSTLRSAFVWRISVTRTTQTPEWTSVYGDERDPYRKLVTIMCDTFKDPDKRDLIKQTARQNFPEFLVKLRFQGPEKFIEGLVDKDFILYSDLLEKQKMWRDNWQSIISLFDMMGEEGFVNMLDNMDEVINEGPVGWTSMKSDPTYWTPGPGHYQTSGTLEEPHFYPTKEREDEFVSEVMRRFTIPSPGCYTASAETTTPTQGIIYLDRNRNVTTTTETESVGDDEDWWTTTQRTIEMERLEKINPSLERLFEKHFNKSSFNTTKPRAPRDPLEEEFGDDREALYFYEESTVHVSSTTKKILTHLYTHGTPVPSHLMTTSATSTTTMAPRATTSQTTTYRPVNAEWVEFFNNITHGTAQEWVWRLISTTTKKRRKLRPGATEPPEDSTMYVSPEYVVDENGTNAYTYEELTLPAEKKSRVYKYTLPSTTSEATSKKTRRTAAKLSASVKRKKYHLNETSTVLSKLYHTLLLHTTTLVP